MAEKEEQNYGKKHEQLIGSLEWEVLPNYKHTIVIGVSFSVTVLHLYIFICRMAQIFAFFVLLYFYSRYIKNCLAFLKLFDKK